MTSHNTSKQKRVVVKSSPRHHTSKGPFLSSLLLSLFSIAIFITCNTTRTFNHYPILYCHNCVQAASFITSPSSSTTTSSTKEIIRENNNYHRLNRMTSSSSFPSALFLIPSQSINSQTNINILSSNTKKEKLVVLEHHDEEAGDTIIEYHDHHHKKEKKNDISRMKKMDNITQNNVNNNTKDNRSVTSSIPSSTSSSNPTKFRYKGNLPDIHWRAIPMSHLRSHPNYQPLPHPTSIHQLNSLEDVRNFRQDSWQWDMLHSGRCTTSQAAPALGLLEPNAAKLLGIPRSLQKGCMGAYRRLSQRALRTLEEMNVVLCCHHGDYDDGDDDYSNNNSNLSIGDNVDDDTCPYSDIDVDIEVDFDDDDDFEKFEAKFRVLNFDNNKNIHEEEKKDEFGNKHHRHTQHLWKKVPRTRFPFAAKYQQHISANDLKTRRIETKEYMSTLSSPMRIRMNWGNSQEATAILTALNYFYNVDPNVTIKEVGMCGAGLQYNSTDIGSGSNNLLLGASPDAVIQYSNGTLEVLEVKNHCPFVPARRNNVNTSVKNKSSYRIREMPMKSSVPPVYIPQLMMEMMCLGDECRSAVMCRQTATNGAMLVRLWRDDDWINEMIYWLERFANEYVNKDQQPPSNFFWFDENKHVSKRYQNFVERTKELSEEVELVKYIPHKSIQRVLGTNGMRLPLFLD